MKILIINLYQPLIEVHTFVLIAFHFVCSQRQRLHSCPLCPLFISTLSFPVFSFPFVYRTTLDLRREDEDVRTVRKATAVKTGHKRCATFQCKILPATGHPNFGIIIPTDVTKLVLLHTVVCATQFDVKTQHKR